jgi:hypothetical protein
VWVGLDVRIERPGYMVLEVQQTFRTERVFAGILVIAASALRPISAFAEIGRIHFVPDVATRWVC